MLKKILILTLVLNLHTIHSSEQRLPRTTRRRAYSLGTIYDYQNAASHARRLPHSWQTQLSTKLPHAAAPVLHVMIEHNINIQYIQPQTQNAPEVQSPQPSERDDDELGGFSLPLSCPIL